MPKLREILFNLPWDYAELDSQQLRAGLMIEDLEISSAEDVITERGQITGASHKAKMDYLNKAMSIEYSEDRAALFQYLKNCWNCRWIRGKSWLRLMTISASWRNCCVLQNAGGTAGKAELLSFRRRSPVLVGRDR